MERAETDCIHLLATIDVMKWSTAADEDAALGGMGLVYASAGGQEKTAT
jgi:hypothetical protein